MPFLYAIFASVSPLFTVYVDATELELAATGTWAACELVAALALLVAAETWAALSCVCND